MRRPPLSLLVAYGLFGAFMVLESSLRRGESARSAQAGAEDRGTTRLLGMSYGAGVLGMPLLAVPVVRSGPYRFVRHPGYLGTLLMWLGFGLSTRDWLVGIGWSGLMTLAYWRRIEAEEALLQQELGQAYQEYMASTPRLIPGLR